MVENAIATEPFSTHSSEEGIEANNNQQQLHFPHRTVM